MTELLSPAGNWDCARAAVAAGADAIYFGLPKFNARLRADNFSEEDLPELMVYLHKHGVRGFIAMNTLIFTDEIEAAERQLRLISEAGVDALIIQDIGLAKMAREIVPHVELHASTQMTITSPEGLAFLESIFPMERAVLSRELSIKEIERFQSSQISNHPAPITPLEVFVHGALCVAYSGQCLTSESLGQRSANRGECAQACRMPYEILVDGELQDLGEHRYLLSPQDLAAVDLIPDLVRAGVVSYKIEGRLKTPEYVAAVTRVYRKALDAAASTIQNPITDTDRYSLEMTFSRGLSTGWLAGTNHPYLTHGKFGKKRGPFLGTIIEAQNGWIRLDTPPSAQTPPLKAGDGIVFDAGENRDLEQGASIWKIENDRIIFHRNYSGINFDRIRPGVTLYKTADPAFESSIRKFWQTAKPKLKKSPLHLIITGQPGQPLVAGASCSSPFSGHPAPSPEAQATTTIPLTQATNQPPSTETLTKQFSRLGDTPYELTSLKNNLTGDCHIPISALNQARRDLVEKLEAQQGTRTLVRSASPATTQALFPLITDHSALGTPSLSILTRTIEQLQAAIATSADQIYCDFEDPRRYNEAVEIFKSTKTNPASTIILATPRIIKTGEIGYLKLIERAKPDGLLLRNLAALQHFKSNSDLIKIGDFSLNVANPLTAKLLREAANLDRLTISYDLNISQVLDLLAKTPPNWLELTLHQHMPMFHMEHCVFCTFLSSGTTYKDCGRPCEKHVVHLRDRVGQLHRLQADVGCRNTLFNGRAQTGARFFSQLLATGLRNYRIELLDEDHASALATIRAYQDLLSETISPDQLLIQIHATEKLGVTEGTLTER